MSPSGDAKSIVFDFTALAPEIDVDALVYLTDGTWQRRSLAGPVTWCLDKPSDAVSFAWLVFSNHDPGPGVTTRRWSWEAKAEGCGTSEGTLTYSYLSHDPRGGIMGGSHSISATVQVHLKANDGSTEFGQDLLNDGSTYGIATFWKTILPPGVDGCSSILSAVGTPGGSLQSDSVTGASWTDDAGNLRLGISVDLPVHEEESDNWCSLGSGHSSTDTRVQFGTDCDGTEAGSTGDTQRFVFNCQVQGDPESWSITGTVIIQR